MAVTLPSTDRATALNQTTDLAQAGATFNDSTRLLDGGLWAQPADNNNQQAYLGMYTTDLHAVLNDTNAALGNPNGITVNGAAFTPTAQDTAVLTQVQGQLQTLLNDAPMSIGHSAAATNAQNDIHNVQTSILNEINNDPTLATALHANPYPATTGAMDVGFQALPMGSDAAAAVAAATAPNATLAQVGAVFNAATDLAVGGLNHTNLAQFNGDMQAVATGLNNIINNPTTLAAIENGETPQQAALTTIHLDTLLNQTNLQINNFDNLYHNNPNIAARSTNDNLLDMIDIVQGDANLNMAAGGNGMPAATGGFAELPGYLTGTIQHYNDNQAQTNFWSQFVAEANTVNNELTNVANGMNAAGTGASTPADIQNLITQIQNYNQFGATFAAGQGGVFGARFNNELTQGTLLADSNNAVHGLQGIANGDTGAALAADQAQILAAGQGFIADAMDVSGNNNPLGGGTYVGTSTTVAGATSVAGLAQGTVPVTGPADPATGLAVTHPGAASGSTGRAMAQNGMNPAPADIQTLITDIQNYQQFGASFGTVPVTGPADPATGLAVTHPGAASGSTGLAIAQNGTGQETGTANQSSGPFSDPGLMHDPQQLTNAQHYFELMWHHA